jgi:hypothetical protein
MNRLSGATYRQDGSIVRDGSNGMMDKTDKRILILLPDITHSKNKLKVYIFRMLQVFKVSFRVLSENLIIRSTCIRKPLGLCRVCLSVFFEDGGIYFPPL